MLTFEWITWLGNLIKLIGDLIPVREKVPPTHRGLLFKKMQEIKVHEPGIYWYWPWRSEYHQVCIAQQTLYLEEQKLTTADGQTVFVQGTITWKIFPDEEAIRKSSVYTWEIENQIDDEARGIYCDFIESRTFDEIHGNQDKSRDDLTKMMVERMSEYGVKVVRAQMLSFANGFPLLHIGSTN